MRFLIELIIRMLLEMFMKWSYWISREKEEILGSDVPELSFTDIHTYAIELTKEWKYNTDPFFGVYNTIASPEIAWKSIEGDCDDFASHLIYVSRNYEPLLLTYFTWDVRKAHTVMLIKRGDSFYTYNWNKLYEEPNFKMCLKRLEKYANSRIFSYHTAIYDYKKRRYISKRVSLKN
ncbi:hypothetical protein RJG79_03155 [Mycoplasmatota bacterium WC44]